MTLTSKAHAALRVKPGVFSGGCEGGIAMGYGGPIPSPFPLLRGERWYRTAGTGGCRRLLVPHTWQVNGRLEACGSPGNGRGVGPGSGEHAKDQQAMSDINTGEIMEGGRTDIKDMCGVRPRGRTHDTGASRRPPVSANVRGGARAGATPFDLWLLL